MPFWSLLIVGVVTPLLSALISVFAVWRLASLRDRREALTAAYLDQRSSLEEFQRLGQRAARTDPTLAVREANRAEYAAFRVRLALVFRNADFALDAVGSLLALEEKFAREQRGEHSDGLDFARLDFDECSGRMSAAIITIEKLPKVPTVSVTAVASAAARSMLETSGRGILAPRVERSTGVPPA